MLLRMGSLSVDINMWNPLYAIAPFALLILSIPLAIFAIVTTSIAVSLLSLRAVVVYCQLATAMVGAWLSPPLPKRDIGTHRVSSPHFPEQTSPLRQHNRRTSISSNASQDTITPATNTSARLAKKIESFTASIGTNDVTQDFESVGGWRVFEDDEEEEDEEGLWMGTTPALHLSMETPTRQHQRSLTAGASPGHRWSQGLCMSPVQGKARTPLRSAIDDNNGYFPLQPALSTAKHHIRRKSGSSFG